MKSNLTSVSFDMLRNWCHCGECGHKRAALRQLKAQTPPLPVSSLQLEVLLERWSEKHCILTSQPPNFLCGVSGRLDGLLSCCIDDELIALLGAMPKLEKLNLIDVYLANTEATEEARKKPALDRMLVDLGVAVGDRLRCLVLGNRVSNYDRLAWEEDVEKEYTMDLRVSALSLNCGGIEILQHFQQLEKLVLPRSSNEFRPEYRYMSQIIELLPPSTRHLLLEPLDYNYFTYLGTNELSLLAKKCPSLEQLSATVDSLPLADVRIMSHLCSTLKRLHVRFVPNDEWISRLCVNAPPTFDDEFEMLQYINNPSNFNTTFAGESFSSPELEFLNLELFENI